MCEWDIGVVVLFTKSSHHKNISVFFITQSLFHQSRGQWNISLNSHYIVCFKNSRGKAQIPHLVHETSARMCGDVPVACLVETSHWNMSVVLYLSVICRNVTLNQSGWDCCLWLMLKDAPIVSVSRSLFVSSVQNYRTLFSEVKVLYLLVLYFR